MKRRVSIVAIGVVMVSVVGHAQEPTARQPASASTYIDPAAGLTLDEAIARALEREPSLRAARAQIDVAQGARAQAELRPNPSASFSQQNEPGGTDNQTRVELQWPLDLYRKSGRVAVADREIDAAHQATASQERTSSADVRLKYGEVVTAIRTLSVTEQLLSAISRQRALVTSRVEQGAAPPLDRDMLRVEEQKLEADRRLQAGVVERRLVELKRLLGMPADAALTLRQSLEDLVRGEGIATLAVQDSHAITTRADVLEAQARVHVAEAQIDRAEREGRPDVSLFGMYMRMDAGFPQRGFSPSGSLERVQDVFHYVSVGAMVTLPILSRNQGSVAAAEAERTGAAARLEAARLTVQAEIAAARSRDEYARQALQAYSGDAINLARQNLDVVRQTYELGRGTLVDVLNEQRRYLELERSFTDVLREAYEARQTLKAALGEVR
jgi:cobalt-zinc-cadmium efflux system outer membrane protein